MSSIASFCLFEKEDLDEFVQVLSVPIRQRTRAAVLKHPLSKFRKAKTTQLADSQWSGYVFAFEMTQFLSSRSITWSDYRNKRASQLLSEAIGLPVDVFALPQAKKLATTLDHLLDEQDLVLQIEQFLKKYPKNEMRTDPKLPARAVFDAVLVLRYWIGRVAKSQFGLLEITT